MNHMPIRELSHKLAGMASITLPQRPVLCKSCVLVEVRDDLIHLRTSELTIPIRTRLLVAALREIWPLVDGESTLDDILDRIANNGTVAKGMAELLLKLLASNSLLIDGEVDMSRDLRLGVCGDRKRAEEFVSALPKVGVQATMLECLDDNAADIDCPVLIGDHTSGLVFKQANTLARAEGRRWLHIAVDDAVATVGPLFQPTFGPCFECLDARRASNDVFLDSYASFAGVGARNTFSPELVRIAAQVAAVECRHLLGGPRPTQLLGHALRVRMHQWSMTLSAVLAVPGCRACSLSPYP